MKFQIFNNFFSIVADTIGADVVYDPSNHQSIKEILSYRKHTEMSIKSLIK